MSIGLAFESETSSNTISVPYPAFMFGKFGTTELLVILVIVIIVFGPKQLPKLSKMFGKTIKNFKEGMSEKDSDKSDDEE